MKFLSKIEADVYLANKCLSLEKVSTIYDGKNSILFRRDYGIEFPNEVYLGYATAKAIVEGLKPLGETFMWTSEYGIWPSSENLHLYYQLRKSAGELSKIYEKPCLLLNHQDEEWAVSFIQLAIEFGWDVIVISFEANRTYHVSHDEYIDSYVNNFDK